MLFLFFHYEAPSFQTVAVFGKAYYHTSIYAAILCTLCIVCSFIDAWKKQDTISQNVEYTAEHTVGNIISHNALRLTFHFQCDEL